MNKEEYKFSYKVFDSIEELPKEDGVLLNQARKETKNSYAPYSRFRVAAVGRLSNGEIITGTNQENASYPAGICAERVLLSSASSQYLGVAIESIAITYDNENGEGNLPIPPSAIAGHSWKNMSIASIQRSG